VAAGNSESVTTAFRFHRGGGTDSLSQSVFSATHFASWLSHLPICWVQGVIDQFKQWPREPTNRSNGFEADAVWFENLD